MGLKGITVNIITKEKIDEDPFGAPIFSSSLIEDYVDDVLVAPASGTEIVEKQNLYGKKAVYNLAIPKGDTHIWEGAEVEFFGQKWKVIGKPTEGIESMIPLRWNKKVTVESYE